MELKDKDLERIDRYFEIIMKLSEMANDEYGNMINQVCKDAMNFTFEFRPDEMGA